MRYLDTTSLYVACMYMYVHVHVYFVSMYVYFVGKDTTSLEHLSCI